MDGKVIRQIEKEGAEALLDTGVSVPLKELRLPFLKKPFQVRVTMRRPTLAGQIRIAKEWLAMGVTSEEMWHFTKEEEMQFLVSHGKKISRMVAYCLCRGWISRHLQGLALDASTTSGSPNRTLFLCSGGRFTMPSKPKAGQLVIVIQTTGTGITFYGGGKNFMKGASTSSTARSESAGQWNFFVYDDSVSCWRCVYANGGLF